MAKRVFYSFHYAPDASRASQVRNIGAIEGNQPAKDNDWEQVTRGGSSAIERWINDQMYGRSCCVVLVGGSTADRKWINYEIIKAWNDKKGLLGVYIHNLKNLSGLQSSKGRNPFDYVKFQDGRALSSVVKAYDPPYTDSKQVYGYISQNLEYWIDESIRTR